MEHSKHIIRAVFLLVIAAVGFVLVRHFMIPKTFGQHGHYRYESVREHMAHDLVHGPLGVCVDCHDEEGELHADGKHSGVSCEVCHAPLAMHVSGDEKTGDMPVYRSHKLCARCHQELVARPKGLPQVKIPEHVAEQGGEMSDGICLECHDAHNPTE